MNKEDRSNLKFFKGNKFVVQPEKSMSLKLLTLIVIALLFENVYSIINQAKQDYMHLINNKSIDPRYECIIFC